MENANNKYIKNLIILFWTIVASRFLLMVYLPLTDTTEARYANIALIMAKTKDWITPYFDYGIPYWGKPPLSFWFQALSYRLFGIHDFVPRLPSMLITLATAWLIYKMLIITSNKITALWSIIIFVSSLLVYALSGVVLIDPYLSFATTLSYVSFVMIIKKHRKYWDYLFFIGLGIGLIAKGPLALVLVGGTIFIWILFSFKTRIYILFSLPWVSGIFLMLLIALPWYILAEIKTPGFLHYFIIGENLDRFLDSGWKGDLYGHAHFKPIGTIWLMWLYTSLPWGLIGVLILLKKFFNKAKLAVVLREIKKDDISFYALWMLFPMLFFTFARNITPTYVLYGFPALGILFSLYINSNGDNFLVKYKKRLLASALFIPFLGSISIFYVLPFANTLKTEKFLINQYKHIAKKNEPIYFLNHKEFSDIYYMNKKIDVINSQEFNKIIKNKKSRYFIVIRKNVTINNKDFIHNFKRIFSSERNILYSDR